MIIGIKIEMMNKFFTQSCFQQKLSTEAYLFYIIVSFPQQLYALKSYLPRLVSCKLEVGTTSFYDKG